MEFVCDICERPVHVFAGASETRCRACQEAFPEGSEEDERAALQQLLQDEHEMGRGIAPSRDD
jgi:LSD1 subclass zinc finger protein